MLLQFGNLMAGPAGVAQRIGRKRGSVIIMTNAEIGNRLTCADPGECASELLADIPTA